MGMSDLPKLHVYYDGDCPLCRREIAHYSRIDRDGAVNFVNVAARPDAGEGVGVSCSMAMKRMYASDETGAVFHSAAAFAQIWRRMPHWHWRALGWLAARPPLRWIGNWLYKPFADNRMAISAWAARTFKLE